MASKNKSHNLPLNVTQIDMHLINTLSNMFPKACPNYLKKLCIGKELSNEVLNGLINVILAENDKYPKKPKVMYEPDNLCIRSCNGDFKQMEKLNAFINEATEPNNHPTTKNCQKWKVTAQQKQYTSKFNVENFMREFPDPEAYFTENSKKIPLGRDDENYALTFLRNEFNNLPIATIQTIFSKHNSNIRKTFHELRQLSADGNKCLKSLRKPIKADYSLSKIKNIALLQELAYYAHKNKIDEYLEEKKQAEIETARAEGILKTCNCCFDDEILPKDIHFCENGCEFCKACVAKSIEVRFGEGMLDSPCLMCPSTFSPQTLQSALNPKLFLKLSQKKALEEVKAAGIDQLEMCPFCDFATIIPEGNNIFTCINPDCMEESCRLCKEKSHIPFRCDEIEKDQEVKARVFIENKMTEALLRQCWKCKVKFFKEEGCNKMTCLCGAQMCYLCEEPVTGYDHFNGNGGDRYDLCPLYSDTNRLNKRNVLKGAEAAMAELGKVSTKNNLREDIEQYFREKARMYPQHHILFN